MQWWDHRQCLSQSQKMGKTKSSEEVCDSITCMLIALTNILEAMNSLWHTEFFWFPNHRRNDPCRQDYIYWTPWQNLQLPIHIPQAMSVWKVSLPKHVLYVLWHSQHCPFQWSFWPTLYWEKPHTMAQQALVLKSDLLYHC